MTISQMPLQELEEEQTARWNRIERAANGSGPKYLRKKKINK